MIIDGHAHVTEDNYGCIENLIKRYDEIGISKGVLVPGGMLDVRKMSKYISGQEKPRMDYIPNFLVKEAMEKYKDRFYGFYCVNPNLGDGVIDEFINAIKNEGFHGLKLAPIIHQFSLCSNVVKELAKVCEELNVPMYFHTTHFQDSSNLKVRELATEFKKTKLILGHMGCGQADTEAVNLARDCSNLYLETSSSSTLIVKEAMKVLGDSKIIFGSEYPMDDPLYALTKITCLNLKESEFENITCNNILRLIKEKR